MHHTLFGVQHTICPELVHAGVLRPGQYVRLAEFNIVEGALCVQLHTETALFVQFAILLVEVEIQLLVDDLQCGADAHGGAVRLQHLGIAGVDPHTGANGGLRQIHRGDVAGLEFLQGGFQLPFQGVDEVPAGTHGGVCGTFAADQDDGGG